MKKKVALAAGLSLLVMSSTAVGVFAGSNMPEIKAFLDKELKVEVNSSTQLQLKDAAGKDVSPIFYEGSYYLPARAIAEGLGAEVVWDKDNHAIKIKTEDKADGKYINLAQDEQEVLKKYNYELQIPIAMENQVVPIIWKDDALAAAVKDAGFNKNLQSLVELKYLPKNTNSEEVLMASIEVFKKADWDQMKDEAGVGEVLFEKEGLVYTVRIPADSLPFEEGTEELKAFTGVMDQFSANKFFVK
jgi:Copper amine oxidase N-terminal domain